MTVLRIIATILVMGPVYAYAGNAYGMVGAMGYLSEAGGQPVPGAMSDYILFATVSIFIGAVIFLPGVVLFATIAKRTGNYRPGIWLLILALGILMCAVNFPVGTIVGITGIILLFTVPSLKKMMPGARLVWEEAVARSS